VATFTQQMIEVFDRYTAEVDASPTPLEDVAQWAVTNGLYRPNLKTVVQLCREDLANALRQDKRIDEEGRTYRAKMSLRTSIGGTQLSLWGDADLAPRTFMEKAFHQQRRGIASDCYQLKQNIDHFNFARGGESPIQLVLDFTDDVAELEAARDEDDGGEATYG
jgi:hypothetical protein